MFVLKVREYVGALISREEGQDLVEYALLVSLIALAAIAATQSVASAITSIFTNISTSIA